MGTVCTSFLITARARSIKFFLERACKDKEIANSFLSKNFHRIYRRIMSKKIDNLEKKGKTFLHFSPKNLFNLDSYFYDLIYSHKDDTPKFHRISSIK